MHFTLAFVAAFSAAPPTPHGQAFSQVVANHMCLSPDGKRLVIGQWDVWDVPARKLLHKDLFAGAHAMAFSPDGKSFAVAGTNGRIHFIDATTGKLQWEVEPDEDANIDYMHLEFTPDGRHLVGSGWHAQVAVWDVRRKKPVALFSFPHPDGDTHNQNALIRAWRALAGPNQTPKGVETFVVFANPVGCNPGFTLSPDGKVMAVPTSLAEVLLIELATGKLVKTLKTGLVSTGSVKFSPDGKTLAVGDSCDPLDKGRSGTIELWEVAAGKRIRALKGHPHAVLKMAFSPDGTLLATGGMTDGVRVWEAASGRQLQHLHPKRRFGSGTRTAGVAFLPDGKTLLTLVNSEGEDPDIVHFWEPATGKRIPQPLGK